MEAHVGEHVHPPCLPTPYAARFRPCPKHKMHRGKAPPSRLRDSITQC
ncbi:hypothetical protein RSAG8_10757, partial [Rhizoctonia solani AG-8 WAC10335]